MILTLFFTNLCAHLTASQPEPCFLRCKDNYLHHMQSEMSDVASEWTIDMVTPLQALLSSYSQKGLLERKLDKLCKLNDNYNSCLNSCPNNQVKKILEYGQKSWNILCEHYRNDTEFNTHTLPCWSENGRKITEKCKQMAFYLQSEMMSIMEGGMDNINVGISNLCKSVHSYDKCFVWENYDVCGTSAGRFLIALTHQTSHALIELLDEVLGLQELPKSCKDWLNQKDITGLNKPRTILRRLRNSESFVYSYFLSLYVIFVYY
ncbi:unnamed protein product [Auanema sp. JU1783]|nr:unnamed protein product [Auanema sp. JU1783]